MTYHITVTREDSSWLGTVPGLTGAHTFANTLHGLDVAMREVIALVEDLPEGAENTLALDWDFTALDDAAINEAAALAKQRRTLNEERHVLTKRTREMVDEFTGRGWSVRETADLLGISPGRVSQLMDA
jgi:DNA-directed RNA polymerase specialized sigma subunit